MRGLVFAAALCALVASVVVGSLPAAGVKKKQATPFFAPGNLLLSRTIYDNNASNVTVGQQLPPSCNYCGAANANGTFPGIWNNDLVDGNFGITTRIYLDQMTPSGTLVNSLQVPNSVDEAVSSWSDQLVTSFSSKSELALNLSTTGNHVTFMGYVAPVDALDVSNANTPGVIDPTDPVPRAYYRAVAAVDAQGRLQFTETNAYSGNNGRAAVMDDSGSGTPVIYTAGNAGNGGNPQPNGIIEAAGAQFMNEATTPIWQQTPGTPTPVGSFNITQLGDAADKIGKDTNFRGLTIFDNVIYLSKGSGGNGVNTVYFVDTTGHACPNGVGLPATGAKLPSGPIAFDPTQLQTAGVQPTNMCILSGFPTALKSTTSFPFGIWWANPNTVYVADEGNGDATYSSASNTYTNAAAQTTAGLQKWVRVGNGFQLAYTIQAGLNLGQPYAVNGYPAGPNPTTNLPWSPGTDGLRNITGQVNKDGSVTIYGITSTVSGSGDQGADPNKLVAVTDRPNASTPTANEAFTTLRTAGFAEVLRGVSLTPGTKPNR